MTHDNLLKLRLCVDKIATLRCKDGEAITAGVTLACEENEEIIYDILATNQGNRSVYWKAGNEEKSLIRFKDVAKFQYEDQIVSLRG